MIEITFGGTFEKLCPSAWSTFGGPRRSDGMYRRKKASIASRPSRVERSPRASSRPSPLMTRTCEASS